MNSGPRGATQHLRELGRTARPRPAAAVMGIQAFKAVEIGFGRECAFRPGSQVHDPIVYDAGQRNRPHFGFTRPTNNAGGLEGGMTNGMPIVVRGTMKRIATLLWSMQPPPICRYNLSVLVQFYRRFVPSTP